MKRLLLMAVSCICLAVQAQDTLTAAAPAAPAVALRYGYLSYDSVLVAMPGYQLAQQQLAGLRRQYEAELQRVEQDFNLKYEEFLEGQRDFPETILRKRQTELSELLARNVAFKAESRRELQRAEAEAMAPLRQQLAEALAAVGRERGYAFILNTDRDAVPFVNPLMGEDATQAVIDALK